MARVELSKQANGTTHVVERHVVNGREYMRTYFAPPKADIDALVLQHEAELLMQIEEEAVREKEAADSQSVDDKLLAYAKEQPVEVLKTEIKLTDDEVAALQKRDAVKTLEAITRG